MIYGQYDAKEGKKGEEVGFVPGGSSIHACMYDTLSTPDEHRCHYLYRLFLFIPRSLFLWSVWIYHTPLNYPLSLFALIQYFFCYITGPHTGLIMQLIEKQLNLHQLKYPCIKMLAWLSCLNLLIYWKLLPEEWILQHFKMGTHNVGMIYLKCSMEILTLIRPRRGFLLRALTAVLLSIPTLFSII